MNEVEKMYENAKVDYEERYNDCTLDMEGECHLYMHCDLCNYSKEKYIYPTFTAEKQLELIKWLTKKYGEIHILNNIARGFAIGIMGVSFNLKHFEEIIPMVLNTYWQDLTEEERKQIKNILE